MKALTLFLCFIMNSLLAAENCQTNSLARATVIKELSGITTLEAGKYQQLNVKALIKSYQKDFSFLSFEVEILKLSKDSKLFVVLTDNTSQSYWNQLNHVSQLVDGKYRITVPLEQAVGERGSSKTGRRINFSQLKKAYLVIDPELNSETSLRFGNFSFSSKPKVAFYDGLKAFDFVDQKEHLAPCFQGIFKDDLWNAKRGFGFIEPQIWRVEDAQYADSLNRDVIYMREGMFRVDLPNGDYEIALNWNALGLWDPPFWSRRAVSIQGKPVSLETRTSVQDYLQDLLLFADLEPKPDQHPYDYYLSKLLKPVTAQVKVSDGKMLFEFEGDDSGVALNWLLISPLSKKKEFVEFQNGLHAVLKSEFNQISRAADPEQLFKSQVPVVQMTQEIDRLSPYDVLTSRTNPTSIQLLGGMNGLLNIKLQVPVAGKLSWKWNGKSIPELTIGMEKGIYQWVSLDRNHESYALKTQFLKPLNRLNDQVEAYFNRQYFLRFQLKSLERYQKIESSLTLTITPDQKTNKNIEFTIPLTLELFPGSLPKLDFPVGFIGLNGVKLSYFPSAESYSIRKKRDLRSLKFLSDRHFTSFTGLPGRSSFEGGLDFDAVDALLTQAQNWGFLPPFFTYGGEFLHQFFEQGGLPQIIERKDELNAKINSKNWRDIIFQFSDEASGYSDTIDRDLKRAKFLKDNFRGLKLGGFSQLTSKTGPLENLNGLFDVGTYSSFDQKGVQKLTDKGLDWGMYNQAQGALEDPREQFGRLLWSRRNEGLGHYLEWHMSAINNYPYYDLDGREADVIMAYPSISGDLFPSIKFEQAAAGLEDYLLIQFTKTHFKNGDQKISFKNSVNEFRSSLFQVLKM